MGDARLRELQGRRPLGLHDGEVIVGTFILSGEGSVLFVFDTKFLGLMNAQQKLKLADSFAAFLGVGIVGQ